MADEAKKKSRAEKKAAREARKKQRKDKVTNSEEQELEEEEGLGGKLVIGLVAVLIIAIWLAIFALLIKMDVGGFGSTVLYPVLKDVPVLQKILPEVEDYSEGQDKAYAYDTVDDAVKRIKELETEIAGYKTNQSDKDAYIAELELQSLELQQLKNEQKTFEQKKEKFYEEVVFSEKSPDINEYKEYYELIEPENAGVIYKQVLEQQQNEKEIKEYASTYSNMKPANAAAIFNTMDEDLELVGKILWSMDAKSRGNILGAMNADLAAKVTQLMEPEE